MNQQLITRILAPVAILSVLLLVTAFGSAWYVRNLQRSVSNVMMYHVESVRAAQELEISLREIRTPFVRYLTTQDKLHLESVPTIRKRTAVALYDCEKASSTPQEFALMKRIRAGYEHFFSEYDAILQRPDFAHYPKIIALIDNVMTTEILEPAHEYTRLNEAMLAQSIQSNRDLTDRLTIGMVALGICGAFGGMLAGTAFTIALRRSFLLTEKRLRNTAEQLDQAANPGHFNPDSGVPINAVDRMTYSANAILKRLRHSENDALRAEQLAWVGQMAAGIAHEIRNPLMSIKVLVQATAERPDSTGFRQRDLQVLEEEIFRLEQIVSGFLDFARPPRPEAQLFEVESLVERVIDGVCPRAHSQGVGIEVTSALGSTVVTADPNQIRQIVFNLLFNALDAQPHGGKICVRIGIDRSSDGLPHLDLQVEDSGHGLPGGLGDKIFDPFVSTKETGIGLGLSICRRIAEAHEVA